MDKRFWGILIAVVLILGGIFWATSSNGGSTSNNKPTNHVEGQGKDNITLVEYGDYECPYCGGYYPTVKQVVADYNTEIHFQFRNLPLIQIHPNAYVGARAAEAAALQGKFWQMHDLLYENQDPSGQTGWVASSDALDNYFVGYAKQLGLNITKFKHDFSSDQVNNSIQADVSQFPKDFKAATGSYDSNKDMATPTFFLDGKHITPSASVASFAQFINAEIKRKGFTPPVIDTSTPSQTGASSPAPTTGQSKQ